MPRKGKCLAIPLSGIENPGVPLAGLELSTAGLSPRTLLPGADRSSLCVWVLLLRHFHIFTLGWISPSAYQRSCPDNPERKAPPDKLLAFPLSHQKVRMDRAWEAKLEVQGVCLWTLTFLHEVTSTSHASEYQGALFTDEQTWSPSWARSTISRGWSKAMLLNSSLEIGLPGGCGPTLPRYFRNARKDPLPAPKYLLTLPYLPSYKRNPRSKCKHI